VVAERRQIIAEIVAEDKSRAVFSSARRKVKRYRDDIEKLNDALTDEEKDALAAAAAVKKLAHEHRDAQPKVQGLKKGLEGIGISGEAMTSVYTLAGFAVGKLAGKVLDFAQGAIQAAIESNEQATAASDKLGESWKSLQAAAVDATLGVSETTSGMQDWAAAMKGATAILNAMSEDVTSSGQTFEWYTGPLYLAEEALQEVKFGLIDVGVQADTTRLKTLALTEETARLTRANKALAEGIEFTEQRFSFRGMADFSPTQNNLARSGLLRGGGSRSAGARAQARAKSPEPLTVDTSSPIDTFAASLPLRSR